MTYSCNICRDGGWIYPVGADGKADYSHPRRCQCQAQADNEKRQAKYLKFCGLPLATDDRTFESFNAYNTRLKEALKGARDVTAGKINLLVLASGVDRGKTHLAIAACRSWLNLGKTAKYAFVPLLLDELRAGFQNTGDYSYQSQFKFYENVGLLALDDLGAEVKTAWAIEKLETIIDYRYINSLPTIITTNCGVNEFTDRIRSRIQRWKDNLIVAIKDTDAREYSQVKKAK